MTGDKIARYLGNVIAAEFPNENVTDVLRALEILRYDLTEKIIRRNPKNYMTLLNRGRGEKA